MKSSADLQHSEARGVLRVAVAGAFLCLLVSVAVGWLYSRHYILYYGDAQAHLNNSRGILDSRTPGYDQLGNVWLPLLHLICLPFVRNDWLWMTGLAGSIPVAICFVIAGCGFFAVAEQAYQSSVSAAVVLGCLALNPNVLYLASIPMTEVVFLAGLSVLMLALVRFRSTQRRVYVGLGVAALWGMCLTRYDGWFLIPFGAVWFAVYARRKRLTILIGCGVLASLAPLYWLGHCWWETGNALDFYNGPYSAAAIQGGKDYPGFHDWGSALLHYAEASQLCSGWSLAVLGAIGIVCAIAKSNFADLGFLFLTPLFYVWSIHSSGLPVRVPREWNSYYNTRYGIAVVVLMAFACGAIVRVIPEGRKKFALAIPLIAVLPWLLHPSEENWICWKESQVNSVARRAWTEGAAAYLSKVYGPGEGILTSAGDLPGIYCQARIPLAQTLNIGNGPQWWASSSRPDLAYRSAWAIVQEGDTLSANLRDHGLDYELVQKIEVQGAPALEIYRRRMRL